MERRYTPEELEKMLHSKNWYDRFKCVQLGYRVEELTDDKNIYVRTATRAKLIELTSK